MRGGWYMVEQIRERMCYEEDLIHEGTDTGISIMFRPCISSSWYMDELIQRKTWYMNKLTHEESSCMERIYVGRTWSRYSEMIHRGTRMWRDLVHERCWSIRYLIRGRSLYMKELTHVRIWSMDGSHSWRAITHEGSWRMESSVRWSELIRGRSYYVEWAHTRGGDDLWRDPIHWVSWYMEEADTRSERIHG